MNIETVFRYFPSWNTRFSIEGKTYGGKVDLSNDARIYQLNELYNLNQKRILELGPLEGGHTVLMARLGAAEIVAVEGRPENFIKCCCIKNLLRLQNAHFVADDVNNVSAETFGKFDVVVAIGILYHLRNPAQLLSNLSAMTDRVFIWTHFSDAKYPPGPIERLEHDRKIYLGKLYSEAGLEDPLSGLTPCSFWPFEEDLHRMLQDVGFDSLNILNKGTMYAHEARHCALYATKT